MHHFISLHKSIRINGKDIQIWSELTIPFSKKFLLRHTIRHIFGIISILPLPRMVLWPVDSIFMQKKKQAQQEVRYSSHFISL